MKSSNKRTNNTTQRRPLKLVLQHQSRRIPLPTDYSNKSSSTKISKVMADHADILNSIVDESSSTKYSLLYLRNKVSSDVWESTSLQSLLGKDCMNGGTFLLNLSISSMSSSFTDKKNVLGMTAAASSNSHTNAINSSSSTTTNKAATTMSMGAALQLICQHSPASSKECISTLSKYMDALIKYNTMDQERYEKVRKINLANAGFVKKVGGIKGGVEFLLALGFTPSPGASITVSSTGVVAATSQSNNNANTIELLPQNESHQWILHGQQLLRDASMKQQQPAATSASNSFTGESSDKSNDNVKPRSRENDVSATSSSASSSPSASFDPYKAHNFNTQAAATQGKVNPNSVVPDTKYESKIERDLNKLKNQADKLEKKNSAQPMDRMMFAMRPGELEIPPEVLANQNNAYEGRTTGDGSLFAERMKRQEQERKKKEGGFTTKAMRDLERMKKQKVYSHTQLRICFPDGSSLSARFLPCEKISTVKELVQSALTADFQTEPFDLYITPPRMVLNDLRSLADEQLVPAAKLHVSWKRSTAATKSGQEDCIQSVFFRSKDTDMSYPGAKSVADELAAAEARNKPKQSAKKISEDDMIRRMMGQSKSFGSGGNSAKSSKSGKPKWFK